MKKNISNKLIIEIMADEIMEAMEKKDMLFCMDYTDNQLLTLEFGRKIARKVVKRLNY